MELKELFDRATEFAAKEFARRGEISPMYLVETKDGEHFPVSVPMGTPAQKDLLVLLLRAFFKDVGAVRYVMMCEAWVLDSTNTGGATAESIRAAYKGSLQHHPDRIECITYLAEDKAGNQMQGHHRILRPEHGKPRLGPLKVFEEVRSEGRLFGLLRD